MLKITFLYYEDCPSHEEALVRLRQAIAEEGVAAEVEIVKVETEDAAVRYRFTGSPTILVEGRDIDPPPATAQYALTCRAYRREDGRITPLPPLALIRRALRAAAEGQPTHHA
ncbi:MAG: DF family (seleno)protein [Anaerolineae bacterium]